VPTFPQDRPGNKRTLPIWAGIYRSRACRDEMLPETGRREKRYVFCLLMPWYFVMGRAVFRDGYAEVKRRLTGGLPFMRAWHKEWVVPLPGLFRRRGTGWVKHH
jgi:hypothetical protein